MRKLNKIRPRAIPFSAIGALLLLVSLACGTAATATPPGSVGETPTPVPATEAPETESPGTEVAVATPTPVPDTGTPQTVDKFTIMVASQGNEIFNHKYIQAENNLFQRLPHAWMIGAKLEEGSLTLDPETGLASDWQISEDGLTWEFTIKDGIKFHGGDDLDIEDVEFSWNWGISEEATSVSTVRLARQVVDQGVSGPNTYQVTTQDPLGFFATAVSEIDNLSTGTIISKDYWMSLGERQPPANCTPADVCVRERSFEANPGPGTAGAYTLLEHRASEEFLYERFDDYFAKEQRPYPFRQISVRLVPELSTRVAALQAGSGDIIEASLTVIDQIRNSGGRIVFAPEAVHIWINANGCNREFDNAGNPVMCNDERVRYALDHAIDKTKVQQLYGGEEVFSIAGYQGIASPSGLGYEEDIAPLAFDPEKAQQLLADAGYPNGEGFNGGRVFTINTWTGAGAPLTVELSELICSMWQQNLGINCEVNVGEEVSLKDRQYSGEIAGQYIVRTNENTFDGGRRMLGRYGPDGYIAKDQQLTDEFILPALATVGTQQERHEAYHAALKAVFDKHYDFSPGYLNQPYGVSDRVASWDPWPLAPYPSALWNIQIAEQ